MFSPAARSEPGVPLPEQAELQDELHADVLQYAHYLGAELELYM